MSSSEDPDQTSADPRPVATPLAGVKIFDLSHALSGPTATNLMSLLGATVIKLERPEVGDDFRLYTEHGTVADMSLPFAAANTGKKSLTLDVKHPRAAEILHRLATWADVVVENFRPGVAAKLGLDWTSLRTVNPGLVYVSISAFGQEGPLKDHAAYDHIAQAMSGIMWLNGEPGAEPLKVGFPIVDLFSGYMAVIGTLSALYRREQTGEGDFVDVSMLDSAFNLLGAAVPIFMHSGKVQERTGNRGYRLVATAETYKVADGYLSIGANHQPQIKILFEILDALWVLDDARFATHAARVANHEALRTLLGGLVRERKGEELEGLLAARQVPVAYVRDLGQILQHPHLDQRGTLIDAKVPGTETPIRIAGPGFQLASGRLQAGPVPSLGEHSDAVLGALGYSADEIAELHASGAL